MRIRENRAIALVEKVIIYIVALWYLSSGAEAKHISENRLFLSTSEAWPGIVSALKVMPTGEIINLYQQYTTTRWIMDLAITPNKQYMFVAGDTNMEWFHIESTGNMVSMGTAFFTHDKPAIISITPNNDYVLVIGEDVFAYLFQLQSAGELIDTHTKPTTGWWINPRGNPIIGYVPDNSLGVYHLNYAAGTAIRAQLFIGTAFNYLKMAYTPDGSIGLLKGYMDGMDLKVFKIDTTETVTTTQQFNFGNLADDIAITPDGRFGLLGIDTKIVILSIDTVNGIVTDTGKRFTLSAPISFLPKSIRITDDGKMVVIQYMDGSHEYVTTAFIGPEGDLFWTGYTFYFGPAGVNDMELLPIYVTDVDSDQWQLYN
jgi:WD40 repeat protein